MNQKWYIYVLYFWELSTTVYMLYKVIKILIKIRTLVFQGRTIRQAINLTIKEIFDSKIIQFIRTELQIYYYAFFKWNKPTEFHGDSIEFNYHKKSLYFSFYIVMLHEQVIEGVVFYFVLAHFPIWDWISTGLHLYSLIWMTGDYKAIRWSPIRVNDKNIYIKIGLRKSIVVPFCEIEYFRPIDQSQGNIKRTKDKFVSAAMPTLNFDSGFGDLPQFEIGLKNSVISSGLFGINNSINSLFIYVDEPSSFRRTIHSKLVGQPIIS